MCVLKTVDLNLNLKKNSILGELDYLNSFIGLAKSFINYKKVRKLLTDIQNDIFVIQANIASPKNVDYLPNSIAFDRIISLQKDTYYIERSLAKINHFIVPDGTTGACYLHCVRTISRQVERRFTAYLRNPSILAKYFDRVACLMFALARYVNKKGGHKEVPPEYFTQPNLGSKEILNRRKPR